MKENNATPFSNKSGRKRELSRLFAELESIKTTGEVNSTDKDPKRQVSLKVIDKQISIIRLLQSESRLSSQLAVAGTGAVGGSIVTILLQFLSRVL